MCPQPSPGTAMSRQPMPTLSSPATHAALTVWSSDPVTTPRGARYVRLSIWLSPSRKGDPCTPFSDGRVASLRAVGGFGVNIAHEIGQPSVTQLLPDGHVLAGVVPVMVDHTLEQVAEVGADRLAVDDDRLLQRGRSGGLEPGVGGPGYVV